MNATGVSVTLTVMDANGNIRPIGTTTSDASGFYSFQWTPDIHGKYTVYASFDGSNSYWPSQAETAFAVDPAAPTATPSPSAEKSMADQYFVPAIAGLFVAIIVIGAVLANAIHDATGARLLEMPMTPDRIKAALLSVPRPA